MASIMSIANSGLMASDRIASMERDITSLKYKLSMSEDFVDRLRSQLRNSEDELQQARRTYFSIEVEKDSVQCELESVKKKVARLEEEKAEQSNLIERQRSTIKQLEGNLESMRQRFFSATESHIDSAFKIEAAQLDSLNLKNREAQMSTQIELKNKRVKMLEDEVDQLLKELTKVRKERTVSIAELEVTLQQKISEISRMKSEIVHLKESLDLKDQHAAQLSNDFKQQQESAKTLEVKYLAEIKALNEYIAVQKKVSTEERKKNNQLIKTINEMQDLLRSAEESHNSMQESHSKELSDFEEKLLARDTRIVELDTQIKQLQEQLVQMSHEQAGRDLETLFPVASSTSRLLKDSSLVTANVIELRDQLEAVTAERNRLRLECSKLVAEAEERAPIISAKLLERRNAIQLIEEMQGELSRLAKDKETYEEEREKLVQINNQLNREKKRYEQDNEDLSRQVQRLLFRINELQGNSLANQASDLSRSLLSRQSPANRVISTHLVTFRDIQELQEKNRALLRSIRELSDKADEEEQNSLNQLESNSVTNELKKALQEIESLKSERKKQTDQIERVIKQRDALKVLASSLAPDDSLADLNISTSSDPGLEAKLSFYTERTANLESEISKLRSEHENRISQLTDQLFRQKENETVIKVHAKEVETQLDLAQNAVEESKKVINSLRQDGEKLSLQNEKLDKKCKKLSSDLKSLKDEVSSLKNRLEHAQGSLKSLSAEKEALVARVKTQEESEKIITDLTQKNSELDQKLKKMFSQAKQQKESLSQTIEQLSVQLQQTSDELNSKNNRITSLEQELSELVQTKRTLALARQKINQLEQKINQSEQQLTTLQQQHEQLKKTFDDASKEVNKLNLQMDLKNKELESKNQQVTELQLEVNSKNQQVVELQQEVHSKNQLVTSLHQSSGENLTAQIQIVKAESDERLKKVAAKAKERIQALRAELDSANKKMEEAQREIDLKSQGINALQEEINKTKESEKNLISSLEERINALEQENEDLLRTKLLVQKAEKTIEKLTKELEEEKKKCKVPLPEVREMPAIIAAKVEVADPSSSSSSIQPLAAPHLIAGRASVSVTNPARPHLIHGAALSQSPSTSGSQKPPLTASIRPLRNQRPPQQPTVATVLPTQSTTMAVVPPTSASSSTSSATIPSELQIESHPAPSEPVEESITSSSHQESVFESTSSSQQLPSHMDISIEPQPSTSRGLPSKRAFETSPPRSSNKRSKLGPDDVSCIDEGQILRVDVSEAAIERHQPPHQEDTSESQHFADISQEVIEIPFAQGDRQQIEGQQIEHSDEESDNEVDEEDDEAGSVHSGSRYTSDPEGNRRGESDDDVRGDDQGVSDEDDDDDDDDVNDDDDEDDDGDNNDEDDDQDQVIVLGESNESHVDYASGQSGEGGARSLMSPALNASDDGQEVQIESSEASIIVQPQPSTSSGDPRNFRTDAQEQQRFAVPRSNIFVSADQPQNYDGCGDSIVPSTPTLLVPRRDGVDTLNSPRVPQNTFQFTAPSSNVDSMGESSIFASNLAVDDTRIGLQESPLPEASEQEDTESVAVVVEPIGGDSASQPEASSSHVQVWPADEPGPSNVESVEQLTNQPAVSFNLPSAQQEPSSSTSTTSGPSGQADTSSTREMRPRLRRPIVWTEGGSGEGSDSQQNQPQAGPGNVQTGGRRINRNRVLQTARRGRGTWARGKGPRDPPPL